MSSIAPVYNRHPLCVFVPVVALLFMVLLVSTKHRATPGASGYSSRYSSLIDKIQESSFTSSEIEHNIQQGVLNIHVTGQDGIRYYHCAATAQHTHSLVLLHGSAFTKEDWKRAGILQQLCSISSSLQVTALDLNVQASATDLRNVLDRMAQEQLVQQLPVKALITPSASGGAVAEWISKGYERGSTEEIMRYIETWVPVASNAVKYVDTEALKTMKQLYWPILAIYGNLDATGQKSMEKLGIEAGATVKELKGRHPVYLDSPTEFILTILEYLNVELQ